MDNTSKNEQENKAEEKQAEILRAMEQHERTEIDRCLTWMCQLQGLLFAALGFAWNSQQGRSFIIVLIAVLGIGSAALVFKYLACTTRTLHEFKQEWQKLHKANPPDFRFYSENVGEKVTCKEYRSPHNLLPLLFMGGWFMVLIYIGFWHPKSAYAAYVYWIVVVIGVVVAGFLSREIWIACEKNKDTTSDKGSNAKRQ